MVIADAVPLVRVHFGYRIPPYGTPAYDALEVASQILAGGKGSRLHRRLVRDDRIAQDVAAFALPLIEGHSIYAGWVTARPESDAATVEAAFLAELQRLVDEPVTDDELAARASAHRIGRAGRRRARGGGRRPPEHVRHLLRPTRAHQRAGSRYLAVDAASIQAAAASVFRADNRAIITYVPKAESSDGATTEAAA